MSLVVRYIGVIWLAFLALAVLDTFIRGGMVMLAGLLFVGILHASLTALDP